MIKKNLGIFKNVVKTTSLQSFLLIQEKVLYSLGGHREAANLQIDLGTMCMTMMILYHNHGTWFLIGGKSVTIISCQNIYRTAVLIHYVNI